MPSTTSTTNKRVEIYVMVGARFRKCSIGDMLLHGRAVEVQALIHSLNRMLV